jgi:UDP:flavonoid glycosyltransferase YjiC (YdhE family)
MDVARFVEQRGAGLIGPDIDSPQFSADVVKEKLVRILAEPSFREGAAALHAEMAAMPSPHDLVGRLERLAARTH